MWCCSGDPQWILLNLSCALHFGAILRAIQASWFRLIAASMHLRSQTWNPKKSKSNLLETYLLNPQCSPFSKGSQKWFVIASRFCSEFEQLCKRNRYEGRILRWNRSLSFTRNQTALLQCERMFHAPRLNVFCMACKDTLQFPCHFGFQNDVTAPGLITTPRNYEIVFPFDSHFVVQNRKISSEAQSNWLRFSCFVFLQFPSLTTPWCWTESWHLLTKLLGVLIWSSNLAILALKENDKESCEAQKPFWDTIHRVLMILSILSQPNCFELWAKHQRIWSTKWISSLMYVSAPRQRSDSAFVHVVVIIVDRTPPLPKLSGVWNGCLRDFDIL